MSSVAERRDAVVEPETRDIRALSEAMVVLPERLTVPSDGVGPGMFLVQTETEQYIVDPDLGACTCPDARHRSPDDGCKHVRRVQFERGARAMPAWVDPADCGHGFRQFVSPQTDTDEPGGAEA